MFSAGCLQLVSLKSLLVSVLGCLALLTAVAWGQPQASYRIDTFAGLTGVGDGGPAIAAVLRFPTGVAVDGAGDLYIADRSNNRIRKIDSTGTITTIAGTGERGFGGDGGPAVQAQFNFPYGVAVDSAGNLYIADSSNNRIRKVDSTGTITTIAGTGTSGFSGDGGAAVQAQFNFPTGVAVDGAGNLYIADTSNQRIRKVDSTGTIITIAGTGTSGFSGDGGDAVQAQFNFPYGVAVDSAGNLYIADSSNQRIRKIDSTGTITTMAGTGTSGFSGDGGDAVQAQLNYPNGVAVDSAGNLYIADRNNQRIRKIDSTGTITTMAGTGEGDFGGDGGPAIQAQLSFPVGVAVDSAGNLYIADTSNQRVRKIDSTGTITTIAGTEYGFSGDGRAATEAQLQFPHGVAVDSAGNLYIADSGNQRIRRVDSTGTITTIAGTGEGDFGGDGGPAIQAQLKNPHGVAVDSAGNLYIADTNNQRIRKIDSTGTITTIAGTGTNGFGGDGGAAVQAQFNFPTGVAVEPLHRIRARIRKIDSTGTITTIAGTGTSGFSGDNGPAVQAQFNFPSGVTVDSAGNLYIADRNNHRIRKIDSTGTITTIAGTGTGGFAGDGGAADQAQLNRPSGVAVDSAGNLYIADRNNHRIRKIDSTGTITTIAGTGESGDGGDGGPAIQAQLDAPSGAAVDSAGDLYIADESNHRVRLLTTRPPPSPPPPPPPPPPRPDAPKNLLVESGDGQVTLTWDAPEDDGGSAITGYEYRIDGKGRWISTGATDTTHTVTGLDSGTEYTFEVRAVNRNGESRASSRAEATLPVVLRFAHFANGGGIASEIVLVNVAADPIRPALYFYDREGQLIDSESVVDLTVDLEIAGDGGLKVPTAMAPLDELTIRTHGRGDPVSGSVRVVSDGPVGGGVRYGVPEIGIAGAESGPSVRDVVFPARRQAGGIHTAAALHNLGDEAMAVRCLLMSGGTALEEAEFSLEANGHTYWFIEDAFTATDTSDFLGSVRCTASGRGRFTAIAVEMDAAGGVFTTLPLAPVDRTGSGGREETVLDFAHFANAAGIVSDLVFVNLSTESPRRAPSPFHWAVHPSRPAIYFYDPEGNPIAAASVVDAMGGLEIAGDGGLTVPTEMAPLGVLTISTHGRGDLVRGSVKVVSEGPVGGMLRFDIAGFGETVVEASRPVRDAIVPVRRQEGGPTTGVAIHNLESGPGPVRCRLMRDGAVLDETMIPLAANGQDSRFIDQWFPAADTSDFAGSVRCDAPGEGLFSAVALEMDAGAHTFTTLPVFPVVEAP